MNHRHQNKSALNLGVSFNLLTASASSEVYPTRRHPSRLASVRCSFVNCRSLCMYYRPTLHGAASRPATILLEFSHPAIREGSSPAEVSGPQASFAATLPSCPLCLPKARVSPVPSTSRSSPTSTLGALLILLSPSACNVRLPVILPMLSSSSPARGRNQARPSPLDPTGE